MGLRCASVVVLDRRAVAAEAAARRGPAMADTRACPHSHSCARADRDRGSER